MSYSDISRLLSYDPETGIIIWAVSTGKAMKGKSAGSIDKKTGYIKMCVLKTTCSAHRIAWLLHYKTQPPSVIDHINGIKSDNRIANLRDGCLGKNQQNQKEPHSRNASSKYLGVSMLKGRWRAKIYHNKKYIFLGYHQTEESARDAYLAAKRSIHDGCTI